jgi:peroxiredoxin
MKLSAVQAISLLYIFISCNNVNPNIDVESTENSKHVLEKETSKKVYNIKPDEITKDFTTWYNYTYHNIHLEQEFLGQDQYKNKIDKKTFLHRLLSGDFIAIKTVEKGNVPVYQLYKPSYHEPGIQRTMIQMAQTAIALSAMEGKELPEYHFKDLDGKTYNRNDTKGKILVLKCWFIHCSACVKEFPALNKLVEQYKDRNDIQFISLAPDSEQDLITFLNKKPFRYAVIPEMGNYMQSKLKVNAYPTHLLINKEGKIVKVSNSIEDLIPSLEKEMVRLHPSS